jgi:hypothetical protein
MYLLRRKIVTSVPDHLGLLLREARRFGVPEESLQEMEHRAEPKTGRDEDAPLLAGKSGIVGAMMTN